MRKCIHANSSILTPFFRNALVGTRTQDPSIKSAVLYQLSYERWRFNFTGRLPSRTPREQLPIEPDALSKPTIVQKMPTSRAHSSAVAISCCIKICDAATRTVQAIAWAPHAQIQRFFAASSFVQVDWNYFAIGVEIDLSRTRGEMVEWLATFQRIVLQLLGRLV
jgi:hypothetical protein